MCSNGDSMDKSCTSRLVFNGEAHSRVDGLDSSMYGSEPPTNGSVPLVNGFTYGHSGHDDVLRSSGPAPIAVCGLAMRLPGGIRDANGLWDLLINGQDARGLIPEDRYSPQGFDGKLGKKGAIKTQHGYFLDEDLASLDSSFFSMTSEELSKTDPQQRQILEVARECLENAGEVNYRGKPIGCYVGTFSEDWLRMGAQDGQYSGRYLINGHSDLMIANRVSYEYDLLGPSMVIKTGCSASMVSLHEACRAIQGGDCSAAIVAGANLILGPATTAEETAEEILSPEGSSKTFDAAADGFARAEAINAIFIKKLDDAIGDKNPIRAVIRNTGTNSDGKSSSIMQPNSHSHELLMRKVYKDARLDPRFTGFVECHGTGTSTGDPIELEAVASVFGTSGVHIGSLKPNVGHSEGASGISSLFKAVLALEHQTIPPNIKFKNPNPRIPFDTNHLKVPVQPTAWPAGRDLRISINSFGIGGANAHVILDSPKELGIENSLPTQETRATSALCLFSANTKASLEQQIANIYGYSEHRLERISDLAYTLAIRREHLSYRAFAISGEDCKLGKVSPLVKMPAKIYSITMAFTGQGAQWPRMGSELVRSDKYFREDIRTLDDFLQSIRYPPTWTIEDELLKDPQTSQLHCAEIAQPVCTALQIALANKLHRSGIRPTAVVGHSSGEIAAAYACGALSFQAALIVAYYRGFVTKGAHTRGGMAAVGLGKRDVSMFLTDRTVMACENSEESTTISGDLTELDDVLARIRAAKPDALVRKLKVDMAYHSHHMKPLARRYQELIEEEFQDKAITLNDASMPFYSSVTEETIKTAKAFGAHYWVSNLTNPVLFRSAAKNALSSKSKDIFLEIGPHSTLAGPLRSAFQRAKVDAPYVTTMLRGQDCERMFLTAIGELFQHGASIDFPNLVPQGEVLTDLPPYAWDHSSRYWYELQSSRDWRFRRFGHHCLLGLRVSETSDMEPCWRNSLSVEDEPWLYDHKIQGDAVLPFAGYCTMAGEAMRQISGNETGYGLRNVVAPKAMRLTESKPVEVRTTLRPHDLRNYATANVWDFMISSYQDSGWVIHCEGEVRLPRDNSPTLPPPSDLVREVPPATWYETLEGVGVTYGPYFQCLRSIRTSTTQRIAKGTIKSTEFHLAPAFVLSPCTIDACLQLASVALAKGLNRNLTNLALPTLIEEIDVSHGAKEMTATAWSLDESETYALELVADGRVALRLSGLTYTQLKDTAPAEVDYHAAAELEWLPHFDYVNYETLLTPPILDLEKIRLREEVTLLCIIDIAEKLPSLETKTFHMLKFRNWVNYKFDQAKHGSYPILEEKAKEIITLATSERKSRIDYAFERLFAISEEDALTESIKRIWQQIEAIFVDETSGLNIIMEDNLATTIYNGCSFDHTNLIRLMAHTQPNLRILEVGAGTGGTTQTFLKHLVDNGARPLYKLYTFTDVSDGFFPQAKERFSYAPNMEFKVFDISQCPLKQGFEPESYDLILAANVVHATPSLHDTLTNLRTLVNGKGRLALTELSTTLSAWDFVFGTLPGWWLGEADDRPDRPYVPVERWNRELQKAGFKGTDTVVYDADEPYRYSAVIITQPQVQSAQKEDGKTREITVLCDRPEEGVAKSVIDALTRADYICSTLLLGKPLPPIRSVISILDLESKFWVDMNEDRFKALQALLQSHTTQKLLWLTSPSQMYCKDPHSAQSIGVTRTIRSVVGIPLYTLEIDARERELGHLVTKIFMKVEQSDDTETLLPDREFAVHNGTIHVGRYRPFSLREANRDIVREDTAYLKSLALNKLRNPQGNQAWTLQTPSNETKDGDIVIGVRALSLDLASDDKPRVRGISGLVRSLGRNVDNVTIGDRVMGVWPLDAIVNQVTLPAILATRIPEDLTFELAATLAEAFVTAACSLMDIGQLQNHHSVLITSATTPVGQVAIQICQKLGAKVYARVSSEEEAKELVSVHRLSEDDVFQENDTTLAMRLLHNTHGRGVDIFLGCPGEHLLQSAWKCVAAYGKFIDVGAEDLSLMNKADLRTFLTNRSFCSIDIYTLIRDRPKEIERLLNTCVSWYSEGKISPARKITSIAAQDLPQSFQSLEASTPDTVAVTIPHDLSNIKVTPRNRRLALDADATYLLTGGLGGLGMSLMTWLVERGARAFVVLSPSAGVTPESKRLIREVQSLGCSIFPVTGQVQSSEDVMRAVTAAPGPIRGVIHFAMRLRDAPLVEMSYEDWTAAMEPKVDGALNLHDALGHQPLDFFFLASSLFTVIEQPNQANYNAANTFLEAFCQYRHSLGLPASVLNICPVSGIGFFAYNPQIKLKMEAQGHYFLGEQAFLDFAEHSILNQHPNSVASRSTGPISGFKNPCQTLMGLHSKLHLDNPKNRASWRRDRRMGHYHNDSSTSFGPRQNTTAASSTTSSELLELLNLARSSPGVLLDNSSAELLAHSIGKKALEYRLRPDEEVDTGLSLVQMGIDSLKAIELRRWWKGTFGLEVNVFEILEGVPLEVVGKVTAERIREVLVEEEGERGSGEKQ